MQRSFLDVRPAKYSCRVATMKYDRTVIAYHGCDPGTAERLLHGEPFKKSQNDYDWLGSGLTSGSTAPIERCVSRTTRRPGARSRRLRSSARSYSLDAASI